MLNRTNLTLSALTNRLNLGTRTLVLNASGNNGKSTLRIRQVHHDVMRQRMVWYVVSSFNSRDTTFRPCQTRSFPARSNLLFGARTRNRVALLASEAPCPNRPSPSL